MPRILLLEQQQSIPAAYVELLELHGLSLVRPANSDGDETSFDLVMCVATGQPPEVLAPMLAAQHVVASLPILVLADFLPPAPLTEWLIVGWLVAPFDQQQLLGAVRSALHTPLALHRAANTGNLYAQLAMTERERLAQSEADSKKDEFISQIAHDLKNPMASIKGYADLMRRRLGNNPDDPNRKGLDIIASQVGRMNTLLDQLLDFSRINLDRFQLQSRPVQLNSLVQSVIDEVQPTTQRHAIQLMAEPSSTMVLGDHARLCQVFQHLLANAIRFSPQPGTIVVAITADQQQVQIAISDKGLGIPSAEQPYVFDRFFRSTNVREKQPGLGLGLFLANEIVLRHGGTIDVASEEGQGSTFTVSLPLLATAEEAQSRQMGV